jgi:multidrug resistance efflux pump
MSFRKRFRLAFGILVVLAILGGLVVYLNYSMAHVSSVSAKLLTDSYTIGTDYSGIITKQYVTEGQHVNSGDKLFAIKSSLLSSDVASGSIAKNDIAYSLDSQNNIILKATGSGTIADIAYLEGSFVPANKEVATITKAGSLYVQASYSLSPPDYARVHNGDIVKVTLPNDQTVNAVVFDISVQSSGNTVQTVVKARVKGLDSSSAFTAGTPVTTELQLSGKTLYNSLNEGAKKLFQPKG